MSEGICKKAPSSPQEFLDSRWSYMFEHLSRWWQHVDSCIQMGTAARKSMPKSSAHYGIWRDIIQMATSPVLATECYLLWEVLHDLLTPAVSSCHSRDDELNFASGYLSRMWPTRVLQDLRQASFMTTHPHFALTQTILSAAMLDETSQHVFYNEILPVFTSAIAAALQKHASRCFCAPLLLCMGASTTRRTMFWRAWRTCINV